MQMIKRLEVVVYGESPMMQNKVPLEVLLGLLDGTKKPKSKQGQADTRQIAEDHLYQFAAAGKKKEHYVGLPLKNLMSCLVGAGRYVRLDGKRQLSTKDSTLLTGMLSLSGEPSTTDEPHVRLLRPVTGKGWDKWAACEWVESIMRGRNPNSSDMVAICRPLIPEWAFRVVADFDDAMMGVDKLRETFDIAGRFIGLCEYRPERKGGFGRFRIDCWREI
jgi:hypothetical protein